MQILPTIQPIVEKLVNFIRSPTYVWAKEQRVFSDKQVEEWKHNPDKHLAKRKAAESFTNCIFGKCSGVTRKWQGLTCFLGVYLRDTEIQIKAKDKYSTLMRKALEGSSLEHKMVPEWAIGCRRLTPGPGYLEVSADSTQKTAFAHFI